MQSQFFDPTQASNPDPPTNPAPTHPPAKRIFLYDGQIFEDPGPTYRIRDVLEALASTYPELDVERGTWHSRRLPDGTEEITFVKVTGEKGSEPEPPAGQAGFLETPSAADPPLLPGPTASAPRRVFLYDGQIFEDPGPAYTTREVLTFLASTYPELENGTWHSRRLPDGTEEITFVKVTGEKGSQPPRARLGPDLSPQQLAAWFSWNRPTCKPPVSSSVLSRLRKQAT
jgi:PRTRC genetic system protein C